MPQADAAPHPETDWALRARRLEALCDLAAGTAGLVEVDAVWSAVCAHLPEVLGAGSAALRTPLRDSVCTWGGEPAPDLLEALVDAAPGSPEWVTLGGGGRALRLPLHGGDGSLGAFAVAWPAPPPDEAEIADVARLLARFAASSLAGVRAQASLARTAYQRERFFSAMSHDLRTPITAIVGYSELLADGIAGDLTRQQQEMVERISQVSAHLAQLVNDILDLAKLDAGRMEFHPQQVRLGDLVDEALVAVLPQANSKGLRLRLADGAASDDAVVVDPVRVRQILVNLLANAVKFTEAGEVVIAAEAGDGRSSIEVRDTGPGLPDGSAEDLFEEFLQIAAGTKSKGEPGSGLGLAISRRLARAMGGELTARNLEGAGAAFTLVLPAGGG